MKWALLVVSFVFSFELFAADVNSDLILLKQSVKALAPTMASFQQKIIPIISKTQKNPRALLSLSENEAINQFWASYHDSRMILGVLQATYQNNTQNADANFIYYFSSLLLLNSGTEIVKNVWKSDLMMRKLDLANPKEVPQGTYHSMQNEVFKNYRLGQGFDEDFPTYLEVAEIDSVQESFSRGAQSSLVQELMPLLKDEEKKRELYRPFLENPDNRMTLRSRNIAYAFRSIYYRIFSKISTWIGDAKVLRRDPELHYGDTYIKKDLAKTFLDKLAPGDLVISRGNWFLSNAFLPGFWPHSTIYLGEVSKLKARFDPDLSVQDYFTDLCHREGLVCFNLSTYLEQSSRTAEAWKNYLTKDTHGEDRVLIEATSDGVILSTVYAYMADFLAGMRPQLNQLDKAKAIVQAFTKFGLEYDFDFDLRNEDRLVCSSLLDKSYREEVALEKKGLHFEKYYALTLGRPNLPPTNLAVKTFDESRSSQAELRFVAFLKGDKKSNSAIFAPAETFYESRLWPKWSFMQN